ncbi:hypothetical protein [Mycobacterium sp. KBS0706]|uniref:hypothetical protein n=1 Tax=Mycobacterium sp. KBS0706 TaxID=2578109 RepID=UPI00163DA4D8|nr:hypothetical protein [Mycobacterium sp. KBS0706]
MRRRRHRHTVPLDFMFAICSNPGMVDDAINAGTPSAASPATEEAAMLSRMAHLAEALATGFQARGMAALEADDLDRAGEAETRFSSLFLGIRRAIALKMKLRKRHEEAGREAEADRDRRQDEKDDRREAVAEGVSRGIAAGKPEAREKLTADLWERLTEDERIDADLADTALPIEALIRRLCREIGLSRHALAAALDPDGTTAAGPAGPAVRPAKAGPGPAAAPPDRHDRPAASGRFEPIPAAAVGLPEGHIYLLNTDTGEVSRAGSREVLKRVPVSNRAPGPAGTGPPSATAPPAPGGGSESRSAADRKH